MAKFTGHTITSDSALGDAKIQRSLRFNRSDDPQLQRTATTTSNTFTYSTWVKRSTLSTFQYLFSIGGQGLLFNTDDTIRVYSDSGANASTAKFRDVTSWYHVVLSMNSGSATVYVNNVTHLSSVNGFSLSTTSNYLKVGWLLGDAGQFNLNGYLAETQLIDGSALTPSSFGFTDPVTNIWMPKRYEGSYGTSGFYLDYSDNSSTTTLGIDKSPNGNDFTVNNFSVSAGNGNDSVEDTPTNTFCTLSPLLTDTRSDCSFSEGNLKVTTGNGASIVGTTMPKSTGKWYAEFKCTAKTSVNMGIGINSVYGFDGERQWNESQNGGYGIAYLGGDNEHSGKKMTDGGGTASYGASYVVDDIIGVALDLDNNTVNFYKNNAAQGIISLDDGHEYVMTCGEGQSGATATFEANFGVNAFSYTPPSGFKSLCSKNLPPNVPSIVRPKKHFDTLLYTGTGSSNIVEGLEFSPDMIWVKGRDTNGTEHAIIDTVRGGTKSVVPNSTDAESTHGGRSMTFYPGGVRWNSDSNICNANGENYVLWCWKGGGAAVSNSDGSITSSVSANTSAGFSIVGYTGNGTSGATVGHGLGVAPKFIITKQRSTAGHHWRTYHKSVGATRSLYLDLNNAQSGTDAGFMNNTEPTSTVFSLGNDTNLNENGQTHIAYCWAEVPGYSKFGSYTGNGNANGAYVHLGFRPALVIFKSTSASENWQMKDNKRLGYNDQNHTLFPNRSNTEYTTAEMDFLSNGFKLRNGGGGSNGSGETLVYMAFAEEPKITPFGTQSNAR